MGKLKVPKLWIEYEVRSKDGKLLKKGKVKSQSWVGNIVCFIASIFGCWGSVMGAYYYIRTRADILDTTNTARETAIGSSSSGSILGGSAPVGNTEAGILVGSSDTPVAIAQYNLISLIAHGVGVGNLQYGATTVDPVVKDTTWRVRIIRTFTNASGGTVTVREFGLFYKFGQHPSPASYSAMLARDVPAPAISVPNGSTVTLRYIISHSLS